MKIASRRRSVPPAFGEKLALPTKPQHAQVVYREVAPVAAHRDALDDLRLHDRRTQWRARLLYAAVLLVGIPGFLSAPFTYGLSLLPIVPLYLWRAYLLAHDLENRRLHAARYVLEVLEPELADVPFKLRLDFKGVHKTAARTDVRSGSTALRYKLTWLRMDLPLLDGSVIEVAARTRLHRKVRPRRRYTKIKERLSDELVIALRPRPGLILDGSTQALRARLEGHPTLRLAACSLDASGRVVFTFHTPTAGRMQDRSGWKSENLEALLDGRKVLEAIIACHAAMTREALSAAA